MKNPFKKLATRLWSRPKTVNKPANPASVVPKLPVALKVKKKDIVRQNQPIQTRISQHEYEKRWVALAGKSAKARLFRANSAKLQTLYHNLKEYKRMILELNKKQAVVQKQLEETREALEKPGQKPSVFRYALSIANRNLSGIESQIDKTLQDEQRELSFLEDYEKHKTGLAEALSKQEARHINVIVKKTEAAVKTYYNKKRVILEQQRGETEQLLRQAMR